MALYRTGGGGEKEFDFFDGLFAQASQSSYTFSKNLQVCYVGMVKNSAATTTGLYTGAGTESTAFSSTSIVIKKIENVKSGDKYKAPVLSINQSARSILIFIGQS